MRAPRTILGRQKRRAYWGSARAVMLDSCPGKGWLRRAGTGYHLREVMNALRNWARVLDRNLDVLCANLVYR